jgi:lipoprotein-releasing system permease protein
MYDYDSKYALMALPDAQAMLSLGKGVNAFKILVNDMDRSAATAAALNDRYVYPLRARDWSTLNRNLFYAIRLEKAVIGLILFVIILVASFNVVSTIMMLAEEKKRQVAMLRAIGLPPLQTAGIYLTVGSFMAIAGAALGVICGRALCALLQWRSIIDLPADIYLFNRLPVEIRVGEWAAVAGASILLAVVASLWPSWKAARMLPAEGLRHE